jgi:3-hydroxy-9,10-secoandrosta-1,3,5(10)-triene-9,17-dione monooxygenase reductase component
MTLDTTIEAGALREVMGHFATGVTVVTAMHGSRPVGFTCQSFVSLSLDPPLIAIAPSKASTSWPRIREADSFCVNVLAESQAELCLSFARSGGDKFAGIEWAPGSTGAPVLRRSLAWVECSLEAAHDAGDHELVIGRVRGISSGEGAPLLFYRSRLTRLTA